MTKNLLELLDYNLIRPYFYLLALIGLYISIRLRFPQIRFTFLALKIFSGFMDFKGSKGQLVHSQAFYAGTGSSLLLGAIIGSCLAVSIGGIGALFWIWVFSFLCMPLRLVSSTLAIRFRTKLPNGRYLSGPMYFIERALRARWLAVTFSLGSLVTVLSLGAVVPMVSLTYVTEHAFNISGMTGPFLLSVVVLFVVLGGVRRLGRVSSYLAPLGIILFFTAYMVLFRHDLHSFWEFLSAVVNEALDTRPILTAGIWAAGKEMAASLGVFFLGTEAGLGKSAGISGVTRTDSPAKQGLVTMLATLFEGFVVSTMIVFLLYSYQAIDLSEQIVFLESLTYRTQELSGILFFLSLILFGIVSVSGWFYTGEQSAHYILGNRFANFFRITFVLTMLGGSYAYLRLGNVVLVQSYLWGYTISVLTAVPVLVSIVLLERLARFEIRKYIMERGAHYEVSKDFYILLLTILPKNLLSQMFGLFSGLRLPRFMMIPILKAFARMYKINLDEAELEIQEYNSLNQFFTRALKAEARIIDSGEMAAVSPVDGRITAFGDIAYNTIVQAKGLDYSLRELLGTDRYLDHFVDGRYITFYLSPQDYHRIHSPVYGKILGYYYEPGKLFPVNELAVLGIRGLFPKNERLITFLQSPYGKVAVIKVGASNVGKIRVTYDNRIKTNTLVRFQREVEYKDVSILIDKGGELGRFEMGSTVILVFERDSFDFGDIDLGQKIQYGTPIGNFRKKVMELPK